MLNKGVVLEDKKRHSAITYVMDCTMTKSKEFNALDIGIVTLLKITTCPCAYVMDCTMTKS